MDRFNWLNQQNRREAGVLLPVFSLPSRHGFGTLGKEARRFIAFLRRARQRYWQILPLGPTGLGDSPYQTFSVFAGNPYFIDLDCLCSAGLLKPKEAGRVDGGKEADCVDYAALYPHRVAVLRRAFGRFNGQTEAEYAEFCQREAGWLEDYALFMAIKMDQGGRSWQQWQADLRDRQPEALAEFARQNAEELAFWKFTQYQFQRQWTALKRQAGQNEISIIGDLPIYPSVDSADVWAHRELFLLDGDGYPKLQAGCPPDAFTSEGQLWGNPVYHWEALKRQGYGWWIDCLRRQTALYDILRLDHFRGFEAYYVIPAGDTTAANGWWLPGPGQDFFRTVEARLGRLNIIAENLGQLTPEARLLHAQTGYPGMKVLQFAFDADDSEHLPQHIASNDIAYVGTHDNPTTRQWFEELPEETRRRYLDYTSSENGHDVADRMIQLALESNARLAVITLQDYLGLDGSARINQPGSTQGNWRWRARRGMFSRRLIKKIAGMTAASGRARPESDIINN